MTYSIISLRQICEFPKSFGSSRDGSRRRRSAGGPVAALRGAAAAAVGGQRVAARRADGLERAGRGRPGPRPDIFD